MDDIIIQMSVCMYLNKLLVELWLKTKTLLCEYNCMHRGQDSQNDTSEVRHQHMVFQL